MLLFRVQMEIYRLSGWGDLMALSGTYTRIFTNNSAFRLRIEWSATQDISGNYSTVWADLYIDSLQSWASVSDATSSACAITINGSTKTFYNTSTLSGYGSKNSDHTESSYTITRMEQSNSQYPHRIISTSRGTAHMSARLMFPGAHG